jgi:hypothetical protein
MLHGRAAGVSVDVAAAFDTVAGAVVVAVVAVAKLSRE